jgi:uncharacterized protein (TIGR02246 family)
MAVRATAEDKVRALIDDWIAAFRAKDLDRIMACYDPEVLAFDAILALQLKGGEAYRKHWETCLSYMHGPMIYEVHDLSISARDDVAFGHYLARCGDMDADGQERGGWLRVTVCCRKTDGRWRIVHEHFSAPFDPETQKVHDLQP